MLFVSVLLVDILVSDGRSHWLEGAQLGACSLRSCRSRPRLTCYRSYSGALPGHRSRLLVHELRPWCRSVSSPYFASCPTTHHPLLFPSLSPCPRPAFRNFQAISQPVVQAKGSLERTTRPVPSKPNLSRFSRHDRPCPCSSLSPSRPRGCSAGGWVSFTMSSL